MKGVILAGGYGTRMRPLTLTTPKPLLPLVNKPVISYIAEYLLSHGLKKIIVTTTYLREKIVRHLRHHFGNRDDISILLPEEPFPLGTAGSVRNAIDVLMNAGGARSGAGGRDGGRDGCRDCGVSVDCIGADYADGDPKEPLVVIQGDNITDMNLRALMEFHEDKGGIATIALKPVENPSLFGIAQLNSNDEIVRFEEKPAPEKCFSNLASTGLYVIEPEALKYVPERKPFDFAKDLFPLLKRKGERIYGFVASDCFWTDVGTPSGYMEAMEWLMRSRRSRDVVIGGNVEINDAEIVGPTVIGDGVVLHDGCEIGPNAVIFEQVVIGEDARLHNCMIGEHTRAGCKTIIENAIIGARCMISEDVEVKNSRIWPSVFIPPQSTVMNDIKRFVRFRGSAGGSGNGGGNGGGKGNAYDTATDVSNLLMRVSDEEAFYFNMRVGGRIVHTGFVAHSIPEFVDILRKVDQRAIEYHLRERGKGGNDFADWIHDVFGDEKLASILESKRYWTREEIVDVIEERIYERVGGVSFAEKIE